MGVPRRHGFAEPVAPPAHARHEQPNGARGHEYYLKSRRCGAVTGRSCDHIHSR